MAKNKGKYIIKRLVVAIVSMAMIIGFVVLFIAASKDRNKATCKAMIIHIMDNDSKIFIDKAGIEHFITGDKYLNPVGKKLSDLNIDLLEKSVKTFPWVKEAELYADNENNLQVNITERVPIARIFTRAGSDFYIDNEGTQLPVNGSFAVKIPVFTGFPASAAKMNVKDSLLIAQIISLSQYISSHPFWKAQVAQININNDHKFELIPVVGDALIEFGNGDNISGKFSKLLAFYQNGLNNVGWGYYDTLDLQYKGQVVAVRKKGKENPVVDSLLTDDSYANSDDQSKKIKLNTSQLKQ